MTNQLTNTLDSTQVTGEVDSTDQPHPQPLVADDILRSTLNIHGRQLGQLRDSIAIFMCAPIARGVDAAMRKVIEIARRTSGVRKASVVLTTGGGQIEVAERIVHILRHHFDSVEFIIPDQAMSAGTVLALSGDAICMDYYSQLGPIDPQIFAPNHGHWVPALGYMERYNELLEKAGKNLITTVEAAILANFDQALLHKFEQARELSIRLVKDWLAAYKFKDWARTETHDKPVLQETRTKRAEEIAEALSDTRRWGTHARGINLSVLRHDLKLRIEDFGESPQLSEAIRSYHALSTDYMVRNGYESLLHSDGYTHPNP